MPSYKEHYESNVQTLRVEDLNKKRVNLTVAGVELKTFNDGTSKLVMSFEGTEKTFVLNKTNAGMMEMLSDTDDYEAWVGFRITLRPDMTTFNGKPTPCIRIDSELPPQPTGAKAATAAAQTGHGAGSLANVLDSDIPF